MIWRKCEKGEWVKSRNGKNGQREKQDQGPQMETGKIHLTIAGPGRWSNFPQVRVLFPQHGFWDSISLEF